MCKSLSITPWIFNSPTIASANHCPAVFLEPEPFLLVHPIHPWGVHERTPVPSGYTVPSGRTATKAAKSRAISRAGTRIRSSYLIWISHTKASRPGLAETRCLSPDPAFILAVIETVPWSHVLPKQLPLPLPPPSTSGQIRLSGVSSLWVTPPVGHGIPRQCLQYHTAITNTYSEIFLKSKLIKPRDRQRATENKLQACTLI